MRVRLVILVSKSPRRRQLLEEAGFTVTVESPGFDDGLLNPGSTAPEQWVKMLALKKAATVGDRLTQSSTGDRKTEADAILGADTVCVVDGKILGQPFDAEHARRMLRMLRGREHLTMTGVGLYLHQARWTAQNWTDIATVRVGYIDDEAIEAYVASGNWQGKAGAYNLSERIEAGWPITCEGDPTTVMGLPMRRLTAIMQPAERRSAT